MEYVVGRMGLLHPRHEPRRESSLADGHGYTGDDSSKQQRYSATQRFQRRGWRFHGRQYAAGKCYVRVKKASADMGRCGILAVFHKGISTRVGL